MANEEQKKYQANDAEEIVGELFSEGITVTEAIERLRTRLLDLSARNRLLSYRHPKGRCVQIVDEPNINLVFERLYVDGKGVPLKHVPEPSPDTYEGKRPDVKLHAGCIGISTSFEFFPGLEGSHGRRLHGIQTILYPAELERQLRKIASEAKNAIEETGTNMLFLIFGFIEFYDSEDSERPMLAPLLSLPVTLNRCEIDNETRTYQYTIAHSGEDLAENYTLREKLRRDFMLSIPEFEEEEVPEVYFLRIEQAIINKPRWKVRRQMTLGMLSFGKLAIWSDLDTKKNPGLLEHELIKSIFSRGTGGGNGGLHAEDYHIDSLPEAAQPLIYDADSSQHSAIIDVFSGKNLVINGPPGTGKSQTITNIIATALSKGQKVLFVSEKLAALEVVRSRLNRAGLGYFCLELHSHKTQKKKFLEDIQARIEQKFPPPAQLEAKLSTLHRQKGELARYAELMGSRVGNRLGLTINEVFWASERIRQELRDLAATVNAIGLPDASNWTLDDIESRRSRLAGLAELYDAIGRFDAEHSWWGFRPNSLAPSDDEAIGRIIFEALERAESADSAASEAASFFELNEQPNAAAVGQIRLLLGKVPTLPDSAELSLLPKMFEPDSDPKGYRSSKLLDDVSVGVTKARKLFESASRILADGKHTPPDGVRDIETLAQSRLADELLSVEIGEALERTINLENAIEAFENESRKTTAPYGPASKSVAEAFLTNFSNATPLGLAPFAVAAVALRAFAVLEATKILSVALTRVEAIASRRCLPFDTTPESVASLAVPSGIPGLLQDTRVDGQTLAEARRLADLPLTDKPVEDIELMKDRLEVETSACAEALARCRVSVERFGITFDSTELAVAEAAALAKICAASQDDLLEYRRPTFGHGRTMELLEVVRASIIAEREGRSNLNNVFYLDALPTTLEMKSAIASLRSKDGFFALFDGEWRKARSLHSALSKEKRKTEGKQRSDELASLVLWIEARDAFTSNSELKECFGGLFCGLDTDPQKIASLNEWYLLSRAALVECPGLTDKIDLSRLPSEKISELATKASAVLADAERLAGTEATIRGIFGADIPGFREAKTKGWDEGMNCLSHAVEFLELVSGFFVVRASKELSPKEALSLMEARAELDEVAPDLALLLCGEKVIREAGGEELGRLADLAGGRWNLALASIASAASLAAETCAQARTFAGDDAPLSVAESFATKKMCLDTVWERVAVLPMWNCFDGWPAQLESVKSDATAARKVVEWLAPYARSGASTNEVFKAFSEEREARAILDKFAESVDVRRMIGDVIDGANTDLSPLFETHAWGDAVCALDLPPNIRRRLLSEDARNALDNARSLYGAIDTGCIDAKSALEGLAAYGSFSWEEWQQQVRVTADLDLPSEIRTRLEAASGAPGSVLRWSKYLSLRQQCKQEDLEDFVSALEAVNIPSAALSTAFELAAYQSIGRSIYLAYPELTHFNGLAHDKTRADYRKLDTEIISLTGRDFASQIQRRTYVPEGQRGSVVGDYTEMHLLRREINKQRRHIPIRQLVKRAGHALQELKPCFMMGPLSVAQYLEQGVLHFDLIVMDEASQLRPEEALGVIARGSQLVVVGDPKQLPPTNFFDRMFDSNDEDEDDAPAATSGMESILDICQQLFTPVRSLRWHYRSHHESLIAFSNHHFYKNLIVFPSPYAKNPWLGVKYRYVRSGSYKDRQNVPEAQRLVDAVLEHMIKRPDESLGVVTLNQTQRELIEELLDKKLKSFDEGADFIGRWEVEGWPFFVKNLENVQGDERDVIFISTTFGKAPGTDKVRQNFGPISRPDGWRRLNVLFTRSKRRIELFTSMVPEDIIVDERTPLGTKALRDYLDFAKRGVLVSTDEGLREPDSDFEVSVASVILSMGYEVKPQLGVAGFFLDMVVRNPDRPGEYLAGIECDGATYHSGFSVRDRDRIRQDILESLGWDGRIHRIWSTDWFYNPRHEIERLLAFLDERRRFSLAEDPAIWKGMAEEEIFVSADSDETEKAIEVLSATSGGDEMFG